MKDDNYTLEGEQLVSLEKAQELKALNFSANTKYYYLEKNMSFVDAGLKWCKNDDKMNHNKFNFVCSAPTIIEVEEWIKKKNMKGII